MTNLYLGNLDYRMVGEDEIRELLKPFGPVVSVKLIRRRDGGSRGFAFAEMENDDDAERAILNLAKVEFFGRDLSIRRSENGHHQRTGNVTSRKRSTA